MAKTKGPTVFTVWTDISGALAPTSGEYQQEEAAQARVAMFEATGAKAEVRTIKDTSGDDAQIEPTDPEPNAERQTIANLEAQIARMEAEHAAEVARVQAAVTPPTYTAHAPHNIPGTDPVPTT